MEDENHPWIGKTAIGVEQGEFVVSSSNIFCDFQDQWLKMWMMLK